MLTIHQLKEALNLSRSMIYKMIKAGKFPQPYKFGRASRWNPEEVQKWVSSKQKTA